MNVEIFTKGVIDAWLEFAAWNDRDPDCALKGWMELYNATNPGAKDTWAVKDWSKSLRRRSVKKSTD